MTASRQPPLRTFLALWPTGPVRDLLARRAQAVAQGSGGRMSRPETLHLTLVFMGATSRERIDALRKLMDATDCPAFTLQVDNYGWWRHNGIAWAGMGSPPAALIDLQAGLARGAERLGFSLDVRPYVAHMTLARDAGRSPPASGLAPVTWHVGSFVLVSSEPTAQGPAYRMLHERALRADAVDVAPARS